MVESAVSARLFYRYIPPWQVASLLKGIHVTAVGHRARDAMINELNAAQLYVHLARDASLGVVRTCETCNGSRPLKAPHQVTKPIVPKEVLERLQMDFIQLQEDIDGNQYILTMMDCYTKKSFVLGPLSPRLLTTS